MNASATEVRIAYSTVPTKLAAIRPTSLGISSKKMIRQGALAHLAGGEHEVTVAQREGLGADHTGAKWPAEHAQHDRDQQVAGVGQEAEEHDQQRQRRQHEEDVGEQRQALVAPAAEVTGGGADDHRQRAWRSRRYQQAERTVERVPTSIWERTSEPR